MQYKLIITDKAEEQLDNILSYIFHNLKNPQAVKNLLIEIKNIYNHLENNPEMFPCCIDGFLKMKGYRKALVSHYDYIVIYRIEFDTVFILGVFHNLEQFENKL